MFSSTMVIAWFSVVVKRAIMYTHTDYVAVWSGIYTLSEKAAQFSNGMVPATVCIGTSPIRQWQHSAVRSDFTIANVDIAKLAERASDVVLCVVISPYSV